MKTIARLIFSFLFLIVTAQMSQAQTSIPVPNGNFEEWSNGNGYSIPLVIPLTVYNSYTYPSNWDYLSLPLNQLLSTTTGINFNTDFELPLLKTSHETNAVPEGSSALKMQSFMLSDIIGSVVYSMLESYLDSMITTTVIPTILSTGKIKVDQILPLLTNISGNMENMALLLESLMSEDFNKYIEGGIPLNGLVPDKITGQYKYTSGSSGDNGAIFMLGTKYNTATRRREIVGLGASVNLTDVSSYTPFEVSYMSLGGFGPSQSQNNPDSLIIFLFSSASINIQQGSSLYLDNLQLWGHESEDHSDIQAFETDNILCSPNPVNGQCFLQFKQEIPKTLQLFSIDGKLLQQMTPHTENITLSLPNPGIFILRCKTGSAVITKKIINK